MSKGLRAGWEAGRRSRIGFAVSVALLACVAGSPGTAADTGAASGLAPKVGDPAPDFTLPYATADTVAMQGTPLSGAVKSGPVLLAFYPADFSPGCTKEVCSLRDSFKELAELHLTVWGISGDNVFAHRAWTQAEKLPFRLLSDSKHEVARSYGSFNPETGFNSRTVFLIGQNGTVAYENLAYSVKDDKDFQALKDAVRKLR
jgi:peroxiredoxin